MTPRERDKAVKQVGKAMLAEVRRHSADGSVARPVSKTEGAVRIVGVAAGLGGTSFLVDVAIQNAFQVPSIAEAAPLCNGRLLALDLPFANTSALSAGIDTNDVFIAGTVNAGSASVYRGAITSAAGLTPDKLLGRDNLNLAPDAPGGAANHAEKSFTLQAECDTKGSKGEDAMSVTLVYDADPSKTPHPLVISQNGVRVFYAGSEVVNPDILNPYISGQVPAVSVGTEIDKITQNVVKGSLNLANDLDQTAAKNALKEKADQLRAQSGASPKPAAPPPAAAQAPANPNVPPAVAQAPASPNVPSVRLPEVEQARTALGVDTIQRTADQAKSDANDAQKEAATANSIAQEAKTNGQQANTKADAAVETSKNALEVGTGARSLALEDQRDILALQRETAIIRPFSNVTEWVADHWIISSIAAIGLFYVAGMLRRNDEQQRRREAVAAASAAGAVDAVGAALVPPAYKWTRTLKGRRRYGYFW